MGLTTSLYTGLSGLSASSEMISVSGDNISNVNTTAFKASRVNFGTQISRLLRPASAPNALLGGVNPTQVGLGVKIGSITRNFTSEAPQITGMNTDMAIDGSGFFVLKFGGETRYARAGNFTLDRDFNLTRDGGIVQGYGVDENFNVIEGRLTDLNIPLGGLTIAQATDSVSFSGNLNAGGDVATTGSLITSNALYSDPGATTVATGTTRLEDLHDGSGTSLFSPGDLVSITGVTKGGAALPDKTFEVGPADTTGSDGHGETVDQFLSFLEDILGIDTSVGGGVSLDASGQLRVEGNRGQTNDLVIEDAAIITNQATNPQLPFTFTKQHDADGESVRSAFVAYDSLGTPMTIDLDIVLESKTNTGTTWRFFTQSEDNVGLDRVLGNGVLTFNTDGELVSVTDSDFTISRQGTGAFTPQAINMDFLDAPGSISALANTTSEIAAISQDGAPLGTLEDFAVNEDGTIVGIFSNSLLRDLGRVALAQFANPAGLENVGDNLYNISPNSGEPIVVNPTSSGTGTIIGGALELSNVDLSQEFISLINASTGFSASSRVVTTSDRLMQELLSIVR